MNELFKIERKMIYAKYNGQKLRYLFYKKKYEKMKKQQSNFTKIKK